MYDAESSARLDYVGDRYVVMNHVRTSRATLATRGYPSVWWHQNMSCCAEAMFLNLAFLKLNDVINVLIVYLQL